MKPYLPLRPSIAWALLYMRVSAAVLLLVVHGLPKVLNWHAELGLIEDPLHLGATLTLSFAVFAEVLCPLLIILGLYARLACLPVLAVLLVSVVLVHPEWSLADGQFAWLMIIIFGGLAMAGPGPLRVDRLRRAAPSSALEGRE
ncbi:DoxX family protein [Pseudomonas mucidolens]|uniref:DoxX family protein n=1 Tax=Pseudomonas mucidolens TaxID=46679 RepID=UPI0030D7FE7C